MIDKLKKLEYISLREMEDLHEIKILYIDRIDDEGLAGVYEKKIRCDTYTIENLEDIDKHIEEMFINKVKVNNKQINIENNDISYTIHKHLNEINTLRIVQRKRNTKEPFFIIPKNFKLKEFKSIESEFLQDEIIFGYKTEVDEPGIVLITNNDGVTDKDNITMVVPDIGFFPERSYRRLKI